MRCPEYKLVIMRYFENIALVFKSLNKRIQYLIKYLGILKVWYAL